MSYVSRMVFDKFFGEWPPDDEIGGWFIQGRDANGIYQEKIIVGEWDTKYIPKGWIDWIRSPIVKGSALLSLG